MKMKTGAPASEASACKKNTKNNEHTSELILQMNAITIDKTTYELNRLESPSLWFGVNSVAWPSERMTSWISEKINAAQS